MTRRSRITLWVGLVATAFLASGAGAVGWIIKVRLEVAPPAPALYVQARFREIRRSPGHTAHVGVPDVDCESCHEEVDGGLSRPTGVVCVRCHADTPPAIHPQARIGTVSAEETSWDHPPSCQGCHRFTEDRDYGPNDCMRCHLLPHATRAAIVEHATTKCTLCHRPHAEPSLVIADCLDCHRRHARTGGDAPSPEGCLRCHGAHDAR